MSRFFSRKDKMSPNLNSNAEKTRDPEQPIVPVPLVPNAPQPVTHGPIVMKPVVQSPTTPTPTPIIYHTIPSPYYSREASQRSTYITPLSPTLNASSPPRILSSTQTTFINIDHNAIQKMSLSNDHRPPLYTSANLSYNSSLASNASTNSNGSTSSFSIPHSSDFSPTRSNFPVSRTSQHRSFASYNLDDPIDVQQFHRKNNPSNTSSPLVPKGRPIKPYSSIGSCLAPAGFASRAVRTSSRTPDKPSTSHLVMAIFPVLINAFHCS
ncbi:hypothetical protein CLU79DRAFT_34668 [Phycomyces nitens]|nr:hypothetical protein CLU79DRAFT_34668 [Phycomyces nitens]